MASTETVAIQQAANHGTQVRSTVALNDRFGLTPGVPLATSELRESSTEGFSLGSTLGAGARTADAVPTLSGATAGDANMGSDNTGSDASAFDQSDGKTDNPFAEANAAEEPTVTHWGTQHLRHASLRVGGEGGADTAIDILLREIRRPASSVQGTINQVLAHQRFTACQPDLPHSHDQPACSGTLIKQAGIRAE